jgi:hypothetical protein
MFVYFSAFSHAALMFLELFVVKLVALIIGATRLLA